MPDRAVVDERSEPCPQRVGVDGSWHHWSAPIPDTGGERACLDCGKVQQPQPRALVALSEDRQWLVVLDVHGVWNVMGKRFGQATHGFWWKSEGDIEDTGQDAHEVLAAFLEGRNA